MTEQQIKKYFNSELGSQCHFLYSTSDDRVFIRHSEAILHTNGQLDEGSKPLEDQTILTWINSYDDEG